MKTNLIYKLISIITSINTILDGSYLTSAKQKKKTPKPITWSDGDHDFAVTVVKSGTGKKAQYKLEILCDGKPANRGRIKYSRAKIATQLLNKKSELIKGVDACGEVIWRANKFKYCYFWSGDNGNAQKRASYERYWSYSKTHWSDGENEWAVSYSVTQSRHNTYATGYYHKNGNLTNLTAIKHQRAFLEKLISMIDNALGLKEETQSDQLPNAVESATVTS